jgi:hypothetical protein
MRMSLIYLRESKNMWIIFSDEKTEYYFWTSNKWNIFWYDIIFVEVFLRSLGYILRQSQGYQRQQQSKTFRRQKGDFRQVAHLGPKNMGPHRTEISRPGLVDPCN